MEEFHYLLSEAWELVPKITEQHQKLDGTAVLAGSSRGREKREQGKEVERQKKERHSTFMHFSALQYSQIEGEKEEGNRRGGRRKGLVIKREEREGKEK